MGNRHKIVKDSMLLTKIEEKQNRIKLNIFNYYGQSEEIKLMPAEKILGDKY